MSGTAEQVLAAIESKGLKHWKEEKPGHYRGSSPIRIGSDGNAFTLVIHDHEHGAYYDHKEGESGTLYDLAAKMGIALPEAGSPPVRTYTGLTDYAVAHGLTAADLAAANWEEVEKDNRPALRYTVKYDGQSYYRYRFLDGQKPKYKGAGDANRTWFGLASAVRKATALHRPLVVVNGEISVLAAHKHGIPACATTTGEKSNGLSTDLLERLNREWRGEVIVAIEADESGQKYAEAICNQLGSRARAVDLQLSGTQDIADFCVLHGNQSAEQLYRQPITYRTHDDIAPLAVEVDAFKAAVDEAVFNPISPEPAVTGLGTGFKQLDMVSSGLHPGEVTVILGATGMGKSTLIASIATALMLQKPGYIETTELNRPQYLRRLACAMCGIPSSKMRQNMLTKEEAERLKSAADTIGQFIVVTPHKRSTPEELKARVMRSKEEHGVAWVMIDSINKLRMDFGRSYFTAMTEASEVIETLSKELALPFVVTSQVGRKIDPHYPRPPELHDGKGSGGIEEDASWAYGLYYHDYYVKKYGVEADPINHPEGIAWLHVLKTREGDHAQPIPLQFIGGAVFKEAPVHMLNMNHGDSPGNAKLNLAAML